MIKESRLTLQYRGEESPVAADFNGVGHSEANFAVTILTILIMEVGYHL